MTKTILKKVSLWTPKFLLALIATFGVYVSSAQTTVTLTCTGTTGSFNSGSVNSAGTKNDGDMITINTSANRGWAKFDLSSIPSGSTIVSANLLFTTYSTTLSSATNNCYGFSGDPATMTGTALYAACASGTSWNASSWSANALQTKAVSAAGLTALAAAFGSTINVGYVRGSTNTYNIYGYNGVTPPQIQVTFIPSVPCTGTPAPGNTTTSASSVCSGVNFTLGLQNPVAANGITYQWESADDINFTVNPTNLGTGSTQVTSQTSAKYYRCLVTCTNTPASAYSTPVQVTMSSFLSCYCSSIPTNTADEEIYSVTIGSGSTDPLYAGAAGCTTVAPGPGSLLNRYSNFKTLAPITTVMQGDVVPFTVAENECDGATFFAFGTGIWIDYNQDGDYTDAGEEVFKESLTATGPRNVTGNFTVPFTSLTGTTTMRVIVAEGFAGATLTPCLAYSYGETEDFLIDISPSTACTGTPAPGNTIASAAAVCAGSPVTLSLQNLTPGTGVTYQWESADDQAFTLNVQTLGTAPTQVSNPTTATWYRCLVDCGGNSAYSVEVQVNMSAPIGCLAYCTSIPTQTADEEIYNVTVGGGSTPIAYANANGCTTAAPGPGSLLNRYSNFKTLAPITTVMQGDIVPFTVEENECDGATFYAFGTGIWIDYNQDGDYDDAGEEVFKEGATATGPRNVTGNFTIPFTANLGLTTMRIIVAEGYSGATLTPCLAYGYGETEDYVIDITAAAPCAGTPTPGNTIASAASVCPGSAVTLSLQNQTIGTGVTYQWESADDAAFTLNVQSLGTAPTQTANPTTPTWYRCTVDCGGNSAISVEVQVGILPFLNCYCATGLGGSCAINSMNSVDIVSTTLNNVTGGCTGPYNAFPASGSTTASLMMGLPYTMNVSVIAGSNTQVAIWIDYNQNGTFETTEYTLINGNIVSGGSGSGSFTIPFTATPGLTGMRVRSDWQGTTAWTSADACTNRTWGETEDYIIDIQPSSACSGTPTPGNTIASAASVCPGGLVNLSLQNSTSGTGVTYQWQSADDQAFTLNVQNLGTTPTQTANPTTPTWYRCLVDCGGNSAYSVEVQVNINSFFTCYCPVTNSGSACLTNVTMGTLNNSTAGCSGGTNYSQQPGTTNLTQGSTENISVTCDGGAIISVWIDFNQNGVFETTEWTQVATASTASVASTVAVTIPGTALLGNTGMRVRSRLTGNQNGAGDACLAMGSGETEDYVVTIVPNSPCTTPAPGNTIASAASVCAGSNLTLSLQNQTSGSVVSYQWYVSTDGVNYSPAGTNSNSFTTTQSVASYYYCDVTCSVGPTTTASTVVMVGMNAPTTCYCTPTYSTGTTAGDYAQSVEIVGTTLNNVSGAGPAPYYTLFPQSGSTTATLNPGTTYTINVVTGTYTSNDVAAWIDYSQNGVLNDVTPNIELIGETYNIGAGATASFVFTVPAGLPTGTYRLRVREADQATTAMTPCDPYTYGETEDYNITIAPAQASLLATFMIQGYYDVNTGAMQPVLLLSNGVGNPLEADNVTVELHDATAPYALAYSFTGVQGINGQITCTYPGGAVGNSYYIVLKGRNAIETWSAAPVAISSSSSYDFTTAAAQSYGPNQIDVNGAGLYAIYNGDVNQDGVIDGLDFNDWETDNNNFATGYFTTDFSGDGNVDGLDFLIWEPNNANFIAVIPVP